MDFTTGFGLAIIIFLAITAILWFLLPFAVFGVKGKLDELIRLQKANLAAADRVQPGQ